MLYFTLTACAAPMGDTISLSADEKKQAIAIAEQRQQLEFQREELQAKFQEDSNRIQEQVNELNIQSTKLAFTFRKNHKLDMTAHYNLDEWRGELVKR